MPRPPGKILSGLLVFLALLLCSPAPSQGFGDFSIKDEAELGRKFNVLMRSRLPLVHDPVVVNHLEALLARLRKNIPPQPFELSVSVVRNDSINAFAAPAGYLFVNSGLITAMHDEQELAAVLAHEMAHVTERHIASNIERSQTINLATLAGVLAGVLLGGGTDAGQALAVGSMAGGQSAALKYSREDEREADYLSLEYLSRSGFDPEALARSFQRIRTRKMMSGSEDPPAYMSTHPGVDERIGYILDLAGRMRRSTGNGEEEPIQPSFEKVQTVLRARYAHPQAAKEYFRQEGRDPCLAKLGLGMLAARQNKVDIAKDFLTENETCARDSALWQRELGRFYFDLGRFEKALPHLDRSLEMDPGDYLALFYKARIHAEKEEVAKAEQALARVLEYVPQDPQVHEVMGRITGRSGDTFTGYLHYAYAAMYRNQKDKCKRYLEEVRQRAETGSQKKSLTRFEQEYEIWKKYW